MICDKCSGIKGVYSVNGCTCKKTTASFTYKCRMCGEKFAEAHTTPENAEKTLICLLTGIPFSSLKLIGTMPVMITAHSCDNGNRGLADLIGYEVVDD